MGQTHPDFHAKKFWRVISLQWCRFRGLSRAGMNRDSELQSNFTGVPNPSLSLTKLWHGSIVSRFRQNVSGRLAIETREERWSYDELDYASRNVSQYILSHKLPGDTRWGSAIIAVYAKRTAALVVSLLGIMRAGCAFVLLDPSYPSRRLAKCINLSRPGGLLNISGQPLTEEVKNVLDSSGSKFAVDVPDRRKDLLLWRRCEDQSYAEEPQVIEPDDTFYVAFTSGTTGSPKAIVGSHCPCCILLPHSSLAICE